MSDDVTPPTEIPHTSPQGILLDLARQQRNLLLLRPLYEVALGIRHEESKRIFDGLDTNYLCLCLIDFIMEGGVFSLGRTHPEVLSFLAEVTQRVKPTLTETEARKVGAIILDALHNAENRYERFEYQYFDASTGELQRYAFSLIRYERGEDDAYYYRVTDEGFLVYLGMLDLGAEDMQILMEKMLAELVKRGRVNEAVDVSRQAYLEAARYQEKIRMHLDRARRVPDAVTWRSDLEPFLDKARTHIDERQIGERQMLNIVTDKLAEAEELSTREKLVRLKDTVEREFGIHTQLLTLVGEAGQQYMRSQAAMFRARSRQALPNLDDKVLPDFLALSVAELATIGDEAGHVLFSANVPRLFYVPQLIDLLLEPKPEAVEPDQIEDDMANIEAMLPHFSVEDIRAADHFLRTAFSRDGQTDIERVLADAQASGLGRPVQEYMTFLMYQSFAKEESPFNVLVTTNGRFKSLVVEGERLQFTKRETDEST